MPFIEAALASYGPDRTPATSNRDILFVHIQKTGGSSILRALGQEPHPRYKHCFAAEFRSMCTPEQWERTFKFAFVRNPWERLVSWWSMINAYRDAFQRGARLNRFFTYVLESSVTFEDFILNCHADIADPDGRKCILRNQVDYLTDPSGSDCPTRRWSIGTNRRMRPTPITMMTARARSWSKLTPAI
jgi:hypothetical protein